MKPLTPSRVGEHQFYIRGPAQMTRSSLYLVLALLAAAVVGLAGYVVYQQNQQPSLEIKVDGNGIKIDGN